MYVCMCVYVRMYVCMCVWMYVWMYIYIYTYVYVCVKWQFSSPLTGNKFGLHRQHLLSGLDFHTQAPNEVRSAIIIHKKNVTF